MDKKNGSGFLFLAWLFFMCACTVPYMFTNPATETEEEIVQEEETPEEPEADDLFVEVYKQGLTYSVIRFLPTDVLFVRCGRGDLVMLYNEDNEPLTYEEFEKATADYVLVVE